MTSQNLLKLLNNGDMEAVMAEMRKQLARNFEIAFKTPIIGDADE